MSVKAQTFQQACRAPRALIARGTSSHDRLLRQSFATSPASQASPGNSGAGPQRRAITVTSDDGRYNWSELSTTEKAARTTQQSFNFILVGAGLVGTLAVSYLLYTELFAADSKTRQFNHAVDRIKANAQCRELLGPANKIVAYGEPTSNKWARARPLAHHAEVDKFGVSHFIMHFHCEGPDGTGVVNVHMTKARDENELQYKLLSLSVPGHAVVYLENADARNPKRAASKMFGIEWK